MPPEPLTTETGMTVREIIAMKEELESKRHAAEEKHRQEMKGVTEDIGAIKTKVDGLSRDVSQLRHGQANLQETLDGMGSTLADISKSLDEQARETEEIRTETADGVQITKKVQSYKTVYADLKKPVTWVYGVLSVIVYNVGKAWLNAHGWSWGMLFTPGHK